MATNKEKQISKALQKLKRRTWTYSVDSFEQHYVEAVRVIPVSDAGGPDNQFWVETLMINLPLGENELETDALRTDVIIKAGYSIEEYAAQDVKQRKHWLIEACLSFGRYENEHTECIQIGPDEPHGTSSGFSADTDVTRFRAGSSLRNYVRSITRTL